MLRLALRLPLIAFPRSFNVTQDGSEAKLLSGSAERDLDGIRRCQSSPSWFASDCTRAVWVAGGLHRGRHTVGSDLHSRWLGLQCPLSGALLNHSSDEL